MNDDRLSPGNCVLLLVDHRAGLCRGVADHEQEIRNRAYEIYLQRGAQPGYKVQGEPHISRRA
jgi:Protein of unknown function (DUF2934)